MNLNQGDYYLGPLIQLCSMPNEFSETINQKISDFLVLVVAPPTPITFSRSQSRGSVFFRQYGTSFKTNSRNL